MRNKKNVSLNSSKLFFVILILVVVLINTTSAQIGEAQYSPAFVKHQKAMLSGAPKNVTKEGYILNRVPSPVSPVFATPKNLTMQPSTLPAVYDMRTNNKITSVKDQGSCGSCWLFPNIGSLESRLRVTGVGEFDLSENNMKHCHGYDYGPCDGGTREVAVGYLTSKGALMESDDPYSGSSSSNCGTPAKPIGYLSEAVYLPQDINVIKQHVFDIGAAQVSVYWDNSSFNSQTNTHYYTGPNTGDNTNHIVLIVGWDDTKVTDAPQPGAWIVKNSWADDWAENGFFYLSYYDANALESVASFSGFIPYDNNLKILGYDELGMVTEIGFGTKTSYGLVKFVAGAAQTISRLGTYAVAENTTITYDIYDNFTANKLTGLLATKVFTATYPGYYATQLTIPINIAAGNDYYVRIKYATTTSNPNGDFVIPAEAKIADYTSKTNIETGNCWISQTGVTWNAIGAKRPFKNDICLKVYATTGTNCPSTQPVFTLSNTTLSICSNSNTTLTVAPTNASYSYKWQVSNNQGSTWTDLANNTNYSGVTSAILQITNAPSTINGNRFRCVVSSGSCFTINSNVANVSVASAPTISKQPINKNVNKGSQTSFAITLSSTSGTTIQWQLSINGGTNWNNITVNSQYPTVSKTTLTVRAVTLAMNGYRYRCVINSSCGTQLISNAGILTIVGAKTTEEAEVAESNIENETNTREVILHQNRPNPVNGETVFSFSLVKSAYVAIEMINSSGVKVIDVLTPQQKEAGMHEIIFARNGLNAGTYLYTLLYKSTLNEDWKRISKTLIIQ